MGTKTCIIQSNQDAERELGELAALDRRLKVLNAAMEQEITAVRARYEAEIAALESKVEVQRAILKEWGTEFRAQLFPEERKSLELLHGTVSWRTGKRSLETRSKWTWDKVLAEVKLLLPDYVRQVEEVNRAKILDDASGDNPKLDAEDLRKVGLKVGQGEAFLIDLKEE